MRGFTNPLSPTGKAELVEPLPHHISAEAVQVVFRIPEAVARRYLPPGLEPVEGGLAYAYVADMVKVSAADLEQAYNNPERSQYKEGLVGIYCHHQGRPGRFSAFIWVNQDWSMLFGHVMGWAKKMGQVHLTRIHEVNPGMGPMGPGTRLRGLVHRHGVRLLDVGITIERREADDGVPAHGNRTYLFRHFPAVGAQVAAVSQLCSLQLADVRTVDVWSGAGHVILADSDNEELTPLQPTEIVRAYYFKRGWTTAGQVELLADYARAEPAVR